MSHKRLLVLVLALGVAGFGFGRGAPEEIGIDAPERISIALWDIDPTFTMDNDAVYAELANRLGIRIDPIAISWSDYHERINIWAASGDLPDVFAIDALGSQVFRNWVGEEIVRPLPEDLSPYPHLEAVMAGPDIAATAVNGRFYNIPRVTYDNIDLWAADRTVFVRQDWMENVGITEDPETLDDLIALLTAFVRDDPNRTGRADTIGMTHAFGYLDYIMQAYNPVPFGHWTKEDDRFIPSFLSRHTIEGIKAVRQLYERGLFDRDFGIMEDTDGLDKFASGRAGMLIWSVSPEHLRDWLVNRWDTMQPGSDFFEAVRPVRPLRHYIDGQMYRFSTTTFWSESYINSGVSDAKFDRILRLYDFMLSNEGTYLMRLGIEGTDYQLNGDEIVITRPTDQRSGSFVPLFEIYPFTAGFPYLAAWGGEWPLQDPSFDPRIREMSNRHLDFVITEAQRPAMSFDVQYMSTPLKDQFFIDGGDVVRIVLSEEDPDELWSQIMEGYRRDGLEAMLDEVNAEAARRGYR